MTAPPRVLHLGPGEDGEGRLGEALAVGQAGERVVAGQLPPAMAVALDLAEMAQHSKDDQQKVRQRQHEGAGLDGAQPGGLADGVPLQNRREAVHQGQHVAVVAHHVGGSLPGALGRLQAGVGEHEGQGVDQLARRLDRPGRFAFKAPQPCGRAVAAAGLAAFRKGGESLVKKPEGGLELAAGGLELCWAAGLAGQQQGLGGLLGEHPLAARQVDRHRVLGHLLGQPQVDDQHTQIQRDEQHDRRDETAWRANQGADWNGHGEMAYPRIVVSEGKWSECPVIGLKRSSLKPIKKKRPEGRLRRCAKRGAQFSKRASRAAMAGRVLPSRNSRKAPPPVEM